MELNIYLWKWLREMTCNCCIFNKSPCWCTIQQNLYITGLVPYDHALFCRNWLFAISEKVVCTPWFFFFFFFCVCFFFFFFLFCFFFFGLFLFVRFFFVCCFVLFCSGSRRKYYVTYTMYDFFGISTLVGCAIFGKISLFIYLFIFKIWNGKLYCTFSSIF